MMATSKRTCVAGFVVAVIVALAILAVGLGYGLRGGTSNNHQTNQGQRPVVPMDPEDEQEDSQSGGSYRYAAVSTPTSLCSKIGTDILGKGGSAVDAAIAATICNGVVEPQSNGIGGGFFMTVHERPRGSMMPVVKAILSREVAPGAATQDMFVNTSDSSTYGGKAIGVPGEVRGYYEAWQMFGRIPWSDLWRPSICICKDGFEADEFLIFAMESSTNLIAEQPNLKSLLTKPDGTRIKLGEKLTCPKLASTFEKIAEDPLTFYHGQLADDVVADISEAGGIITIEDLQNYTVKFTDTVNVTLQNGDYRVYNPPPPSSGLVVDIILKLLDRYNLSSADYGSTQAKIETYHKMLEAFKFAYGRRSELGDIFFEDQVSSVIFNQLNYDQWWESSELCRTVIVA